MPAQAVAKKRICKIEKKLEQAKIDSDTVKRTFYEIELMLLKVEDHVIH